MPVRPTPRTPLAALACERVTHIIDGKAVAARVRERVKAEVERLRQGGTTPALATVLVGDDPASKVYVAGKHKACEEIGIRSVGHELPATATQSELLDLVAELNSDAAITGFIVQLPVPKQIDQFAIVSSRVWRDGLAPIRADMASRS